MLPHSKFAMANDIAEEANARYQAAVDSFTEVSELANAELATYGETRLGFFDWELRTLRDAVEQLGHVQRAEYIEVNLELDEQIARLGLTGFDFAAVDAAKAALAGAGTGAATYLAAVGAVGTFGATAAGTPLAALSGVAFSNALLAWFGGGSLAAGGLGMAGGAMVLGSVVAAPAAIVGGLVMNAKADSRIEKAKAHAVKAGIACAEIKTAEAAAATIGNRTSSFQQTASDLRGLLLPYLRAVVEMARSGRRVDALSDPEMKDLHLAVEITGVLKGLLETPLITEDRKPSPAAEKSLAHARRFAEAQR